MSEAGWSWLLASTTLGTYVLAGRVESRRAQAAAWLLTLGTEPLWIAYGMTRPGGPAWGFVVQAFFFAAVAVYNLLHLRTVPALPAEEVPGG